MATDQVSVVGNLGDDPDLRYSAAGNPFVRLSVAQTDRKKDHDGKWVDGDTFWWRVTAFGSLAENIGETLNKGDRVVVVGRLEAHSWETDDGQKRSTVNIVADAVGPELRYATAAVRRIQKGEGPSGPTAQRADQLADAWDKAVARDDYGPDEAPF